MSASGYQQTLDAPRCEVCLPLRSRHWRTEFPKPWVLRPLTAQKQTSETILLEVCCRPEADIELFARAGICVALSWRPSPIREVRALLSVSRRIEFSETVMPIAWTG